jgi:acyl-CoA thioesterase-1
MRNNLDESAFGRMWLYIASVIALLVCVNASQAASFKIVALGASNTNGLGVGGQQAFPAQIQAMLRAKGVDATVSVMASNGLTSAALLSEVDSIPAGTSLVLIEPVKINDQRAGIANSNRANLEQIGSRLLSRGIKSIIIKLRPLPPDGLQADNIHLTPHGHQVIAARYLPQIITVLRNR